MDEVGEVAVEAELDFPKDSAEGIGFADDDVFVGTALFAFFVGACGDQVAVFVYGDAAPAFREAIGCGFGEPALAEKLGGAEGGEGEAEDSEGEFHDRGRR